MPITDRQDSDDILAIQRQLNQDDIAAIINCTSGLPNDDDCFGQHEEFTQTINVFNNTDKNPFDNCRNADSTSECLYNLCPNAQVATVLCLVRFIDNSMAVER